MKKIVFILVTLFALLPALTAEARKNKITPEKKGVATINRPTAEAHVEFLASDALEGRESGTPAGYIAGEYIIATLKQMGATPLFSNSFAITDGILGCGCCSIFCATTSNQRKHHTNTQEQRNKLFHKQHSLYYVIL